MKASESAEPACLSPHAGACLVGVTAGYGSQTVFTDLCLELPPNCITALLGPVASGKSTALRVLGDAPVENFWWSGERKIAASNPVLHPQLPRDEEELRELRRQLSETVTADLRSEWSAVPEAAEIFDEILAAPQATWTRQQLQLLRVTVSLRQRSDFFLLDEPERELPHQALSPMEDRLRQLSHRATVVLVTHNLRFARSVAHRVALISEGKLLQSGETEDVFEHPANARVERFLQMGS